MRTPEEMYYEGWCKDCDYCFKKCLAAGICRGYQYEKEDENGEETVI